MRQRLTAVGRGTTIATGVMAGAMALATPAWAGDGTFGPKTEFTAGAVPSAVSIGDFNSDGVADLVATNWADDDVSILLGTGSGSFGAKTDFAVGDQPQAVAVGDFDLNGAEDLAVANYGDGDVSVLLGAGTGSFGAKNDFPVGSHPRSLAIGDFNRDRVEDLAVANSSAGSVSILLGGGSGSFGTKTDFSVSFFPPAIAVGDFDSDGYDDLVTPGGYNGKGVSVLLNKADGTAGFKAKTDYLTGDDPKGVAVGDFDSDGVEDIAATNSIDRDVSILVGSGSGSFGTKTDFPVGAGQGPLAVGDIDSDGAEDLAVARASDVSILLGTGNGGFGPPTDFGVGQSPESIALGDLNSDDTIDVVTSSFAGGSDDVSVLPGQGAPYLAGNLLVNGGAEGAGAARGFGGSPQIPGWTRGPTGNFTFARYPFRGAFSQLADAARWEGDLSLFTGGAVSGPPSSASQAVGLASDSASIDAGLATARLAADLGGYGTRNHRMGVIATFRDASGAALGSLTVGPVTAADRHNVTQLIRRSTQGAVPPGTRAIDVTMRAHYDGSGLGTNVEAYADNVKLTLDAPPVTEPGVGGSSNGDPAPTDEGDPADTDSPETAKGRGPKRRIERRKATFAFSSDESGSAFECRLDKRAATPCTSPTKVKRIRAGRHTFTATAIDPAGNRDPSPAVWKFKVEAGR